MINKLVLSMKLNKSLKVLRRAFVKFPAAQIALAWTGGKDSTVLLWLTRIICRRYGYQLPGIMFIYEGDPFPEVITFVNYLSKLWEFRFDTVRNDDLLKQVTKVGDEVRVNHLNSRNRKELRKLEFRNLVFGSNPSLISEITLLRLFP